MGLILTIFTYNNDFLYKDKIIITDDVRETYIIVNKLKSKKDIYALYENDLPDTYNEW